MPWFMTNVQWNDTCRNVCQCCVPSAALSIKENGLALWETHCLGDTMSNWINIRKIRNLIRLNLHKSINPITNSKKTKIRCDVKTVQKKCLKHKCGYCVKIAVH